MQGMIIKDQNKSGIICLFRLKQRNITGGGHTKLGKPDKTDGRAAVLKNW